MIGRDTTWRQGSLIKQDELININLPADCYAIVVSHDCDLPHPKEQVVEAIICKKVSPDKMLMNCRSPRKLHLMLNHTSGELFFELSFQTRVLIDKTKFSTKLSGPDTDFDISESEKRTLKQWLSARFGRPAYPNAFEQRLQKKIGKDTIEKCIAKLIEPVSEHIVGVFIGLDGDKNIELEDGEPYCLSVYIVYNTEQNAIAARVECENLAKSLESLLVEFYGPPEDAVDICLEKCVALADNMITLADLMKVDQWRLEWLSLSEGSDEFVAIGQP